MPFPKWWTHLLQLANPSTWLLLQLLRDTFTREDLVKQERQTNWWGYEKCYGVTHPKVKHGNINCCSLLQNASVRPHLHSTDRHGHTDNTALYTSCIAFVCSHSTRPNVRASITEPATPAIFGHILEVKERKCLNLCTAGNKVLESPLPKLWTLSKSHVGQQPTGFLHNNSTVRGTAHPVVFVV